MGVLYCSRICQTFLHILSQVIDIMKVMHGLHMGSLFYKVYIFVHRGNSAKLSKLIFVCPWFLPCSHIVFNVLFSFLFSQVKCPHHVIKM